MIGPISKMPGSAPVAPQKVDPKIAHVAAQFEEVFVRQLLSSAKVGGDSSDGGGGYSAMTIDALATGVTQGGGLGIAQQIERALSHNGGPAPHVSAPVSPQAPAAESSQKTE
jgi:Rod binding domain-containing protein